MAKPTVTSIVFGTALLLAVVIIGVLVFRSAAPPTPGTPIQATLHPSAGATSCLVFPKAGAPNADVRAMQSHARALAAASHFDEALAEYRQIAAVHPGTPALNLEISRMLLKLGQPRLAKEAVNAQIEVSECLPHLPLDGMDEYCKSEAFPSTLACVKELNSDQQGAYLQAALVQMELGRGLSHEPAAAEASATPAAVANTPHLAHAAASAPRPAHLLVASEASGKQPAVKPVRHPNPNQLASGSGTDAALGAYSK